MSAAEQLRASGEEVERACALLVAASPESVDGCAGALEAAVAGLAGLGAALAASRGDAASLEETWRLRRSVRKARALLEGASEYHERWRERIGARTAGYGSDGAPGEPPRAGRVFLRG